MNKHKGSNAERELLKLFFERGWRGVRTAGSGINEESPCDIITGKIGKKSFSIEVKSSRSDYIYIKKPQIEDFILFSNIFGLIPAIAVRFTYEGWIFLTPEQLEDSGINWVITRKKAKSEGKRFSQFFEENT